MAAIETGTSSVVLKTGSSLGFLALLTGYFGQVAASVMLVVISALAGVSISLSDGHVSSCGKAAFYIVLGTAIALVWSWFLAVQLVYFFPGLDNEYLPTILAWVLGWSTTRINYLINLLVGTVAGSWLADLFSRIFPVGSKGLEEANHESLETPFIHSNTTEKSKNHE